MHVLQYRKPVERPDFILNILKVFLALKISPQIHGVKGQHLRVIKAFFIIFDRPPAKKLSPDALHGIHVAVRKYRYLIPVSPWVLNTKKSQHDGTCALATVFIDIIKFYFFTHGTEFQI